MARRMLGGVLLNKREEYMDMTTGLGRSGFGGGGSFLVLEATVVSEEC